MNKFSQATLALITAIILFTSGCSTIVRGSSEQVSFTSTPTKATVRLSNGQSCTTPCTMEVSRKGDLLVTITKEGYKTLETAMPSTIDGAVLAAGTTGNIFFFPIINDVVDYRSRANFSRKPNPLVVDLIAEQAEQDYVFEGDVATEDNETSEVIIYRASAFHNGAISMSFGENDKYFLTLRSNQYAKVKINSGAHIFQAKAFLSPASEKPLSLSPNSITCLAVEPNPVALGAVISPLIANVVPTFVINYVDCPSMEFLNDYQLVFNS